MGVQDISESSRSTLDAHLARRHLNFLKAMTMVDPSTSNGLTPLQEECFKLLKAKQYKSCEILARMELAKAELEGRDSRVAWALLGDCAQSTQQYRRAISYYRRIQVFGSYKYRLKEAQCLQGMFLIISGIALFDNSQYFFVSPRKCCRGLIGPGSRPQGI